MKIIAPLLLLAAVLLNSGCASRGAATATASFDFGPLPPPKALKTPGERTIKVLDISTPSGLDSTQMYYRLNYANAQQAMPYAHSRWSMPPGQLLTQRVKNRLAQAGIRVLGGSDGVNAPQLKIELDDFSQHFQQAQQSKGVLTWRVSLIQGRNLLQQLNLSTEVAAITHDAPGGARAVAQASDQAIDMLLAAIVEWLPPRADHTSQTKPQSP